MAKIDMRGRIFGINFVQTQKIVDKRLLNPNSNH